MMVVKFEIARKTNCPFVRKAIYRPMTLRYDIVRAESMEVPTVLSRRPCLVIEYKYCQHQEDKDCGEAVKRL